MDMIRLTESVLEELTRIVGDDGVREPLIRLFAPTSAENVMEQMDLVPALYSYWSVVSERLQRELRQEETAYEMWESEVFLLLRAKQRATVKELEALIKTQDEYPERKERLRKKSFEVNLVKRLLEALKLKGEMLVLQGALLRREATLEFRGNGYNNVGLNHIKQGGR